MVFRNIRGHRWHQSVVCNSKREAQQFMATSGERFHQLWFQTTMKIKSGTHKGRWAIYIRPKKGNNYWKRTKQR